MIKNTPCLSRVVPTCSELGGRTPGSKLPASPPPLPRPDGGGQPWPCACAHGPKKSTRRRACHQPVQETMPTAELPQLLHCLDQPQHLSIHNDGHVTNKPTNCNCGISQSSPRLHRNRGEPGCLLHDCTRGNCGPAHRDVEHYVNVLQQEDLNGL